MNSVWLRWGMAVIIGLLPLMGGARPAVAAGVDQAAGPSVVWRPVSGERCPWTMYIGGGGGGGGGGQSFITPASSAASPVLARLRGHKDAIDEIVYSPDGRWIATSDGNDVRVWDAANGTQQAVLADPAVPVTAPQFSPDSRWLAAKVGDAAGRIWDVAAWTTRMKIPDGVVAAFSADSRFVAAAGSKGVQLFEVSTGSARRTLANARPPVSFSPDGKAVATVAPTTRMAPIQSVEWLTVDDIVLWDVSTGARVKAMGADATLLGQYLAGGEKGHPHVTSLAFSADGKRLLSFGSESAVRLWDVATGKHLRCLRTTPYPDSIPSAGVENSRARLYGRGNDVFAVIMFGSLVYLWNAIQDRMEAAFEIPGFAAEATADMALATGGPEPLLMTWTSWSLSKTGRTAFVWNLNSGQLTGMLRHPAWLTAAALAPAGPRAVVAYRYDVLDPAKVQIRGAGEGWLWDLNHAQVTLPAAAAELLRQGLAAAAKKDPAAKDLLRKAQALDPDPAFAYDLAQAQRDHAAQLLNDGGLLARTGDLAGAAGQYRQALALNPTLDIKPDVQARQVYADELQARGTTLAEIGDYRGAVALLRQAAGLDPVLQIDPEGDAAEKAGVALVAQGDYLAATGNSTAAVAKYRAAMSADPTLIITPDARAQRRYELAQAEDLRRKGDALAQAGKLDTAAAAYGGALANNPLLAFDPSQEAARVYANALVDQGMKLAGEGDVQAATANFAQAQELNPSLTYDPAAQADQAYRNRLVADPNRAAADLAAAGDIRGAVAKYNEVLAILPDENLQPEQKAREVYLQRLLETAQTVAAAGNLDSAIALYRKAADFDPAQGIKPEAAAKTDYAAALKSQADEQARNGDLAAAASTYKRALALDPTLGIDPVQAARSAYAAQLAYEADWQVAYMGQIDQAIAQYTAAKRLDPALDVDPVARANQQWAIAMTGRARELAGRGNIDQATALYRQALALNPALQVAPEKQAWSDYAAAQVSAASDLMPDAVDDAATQTYLQNVMNITQQFTLSTLDLAKLCSWGVLLTQDERYLPACDVAVKAAPNDASYRDRRALARVLLRNVEGAIADLQEANQIDGAARDKAQDIARRQAQIETLQSGGDPNSIFTWAVVKDLRQAW